MIRLSLYDFDKTIFRKDTGIEVLIHLFFRYPKTWIYLPYIMWGGVLYLLKLIPTLKLKEIVFSPISLFSKEEWDVLIEKFWDENKDKLFPLVIDQIQEDKKNEYIVGIVSASFEILLYPIMNIVPADFLIGTTNATEDRRLTSKIIGKNCKKEEKISRLHLYMKDHYLDQEYCVKKMYSDSLHDLALLELAETPYTVEPNGSIREGLPKENKNI